MKKYFLWLVLASWMVAGGALAQEEAKKVLALSDFSGAVISGQAVEIGSGKDAAKINWENYGAISFYIKGTSPGVSLAFDIKDTLGKVFRFIVKDVSGDWKQVVCPFAEFFPYRDGQLSDATADDVLDFPILSFQFEPMAATQGTFYVDEISLEPLD
jgi:hypothetical protein